MPLGGFGFISLFYAFLGVRFAIQFWPQRKAVFDRDFTANDRSMVTQAAFFFLLPVAVLLHEAGHAIAIKLFGGEIVDFGFYFFAGYVSYYPQGFSDLQQMIVAFAGTLVNLLLIIVAMGVVFLWRPPLRAAYNELLIQFSIISGLNAFVLYPMLDLASGLNGDWTQMYDGNVPWFTALILAIQLGFIATGLLISRNPRTRAILAQRTGSENARGLWKPATSENPGKHAVSPEVADREQPALIVAINAANRVTSGWPQPVVIQNGTVPGAPAIIVTWQDALADRLVALRVGPGDGISIAGGTWNPDAKSKASVALLKSWSTLPEEDEVVLALRIAMETVANQEPDGVRP